jgi:ATP-dependent Clp protease adaptor protein ClpS
MSDQGTPSKLDEQESSGGTVVAAPEQLRQPATSKTPPAPLPPWKVLLHNDDNNEMLFVIHSIVELTPLSRDEAMHRMFEAHKSGVALLLVTHKERAELYMDQFQSKGLTITIEPQS